MSQVVTSGFTTFEDTSLNAPLTVRLYKPKTKSELWSHLQLVLSKLRPNWSMRPLTFMLVNNKYTF